MGRLHARVYSQMPQVKLAGVYDANREAAREAAEQYDTQAFENIDVGFVLDMLIHAIDIVLSLSGSKVSRVDAVGVSIIGNVEDVCNARLEFENGCVANLTASRVALKSERKLRVFSPDVFVSLDYQKKYGIVAQRSGNLQAIRSAVAKIRSGEIEDLTGPN